MALILEVKAGKLAGKRIELRPGQKVTVGRAPERSDFAIPDDSFMSGAHFSVELGPRGCRIIDRKSSNGTFLNGAKISEAMLADGDEVRSGKTIFLAKIVPEENLGNTPAREAPVASATSMKPPRTAERAAPKTPKPAPSRPAVPPIPEEPTEEAPAAAPPKRPTLAADKQIEEAPVVHPPPPPPPAIKRPPAKAPTPAAPAAAGKPGALIVGCWKFATVPEGWEPQGEFGMQRVVKDGFPASVVATEEHLSGATLQRYVEAQVSMLRKYLREPQIEASLPPTIPGSEETVALDVRYSTNDNQVILIRRVFARQGERAGALAITTLEKDLADIRPALDAILAGAAFQPEN